MNMLDIGLHTVTLQAALTNYPTATPISVTFSVTLVDPCPTTVLSLPALSTFTISAFDGIGFTQTFTPASDSASTTAAVTGLCGPVTYSILEAQPATFVSIISPGAGLELTNPWTLTALSNNFADVGTWTITLQAVLTNFPTITATSAIASAIV
jgi:hypothetical protein